MRCQEESHNVLHILMFQNWPLGDRQPGLSLAVDCCIEGRFCCTVQCYLIRFLEDMQYLLLLHSVKDKLADIHCNINILMSSLASWQYVFDCMMNGC